MKAAKQPRAVVKKGEVFVIDNGRRSTPIVDDTGAFFISTQAAGKARDLHPTSIALAVRKGGETKAGGHKWRRATLEECADNGLKLLGRRPKATKKAKRVKSKEKDPITVVKVSAKNVRLSNGQIPVVNDKGDFYISGRAASLALKMGPAAVAGALFHDRPVGGHKWRYATLEDCKANGIGVGVGGKSSLIEIPYQEAGAKKLGRPKKAPKKAQEAPEATFYGVRWPDGAVTIRANHGSTWTMTRVSEEDVPKEMIAEAVWIGA
jgi:hypothetical protein